VLWDLRRHRAHFHFHAHDGLTRHAHWHRHNEEGASHRHPHGAVMVGMLHGTAGSAPLLAVLPFSVQTQPWFGLIYLVMFGLGVLLSMTLFGGVLGALFRGLSRKSWRLMRALRISVALGSIGLGGYLVHSAL
jgi:sulfite exporter TauE/SafE